MPALVRSFLFCPASRPDMVIKAMQSATDAVIIDLEDAVALSEKETARKTVPELLAKKSKAKAYVRINSIDTQYALNDLLVVLTPQLDGIMLPKVEQPADIQKVDWVINSLEKERQIEPGKIEILPLIETATGILGAENIGRASRRLCRLAFGVVDFTRDTNVNPIPPENNEILYAMSHLVLASRAAGIFPPVDSVYTNTRDILGLEKDTLHGKRLGFFGKALIHPGQIETVNRTFTPSEAEISEARQLDQAFTEAENRGIASIQFNGKMVDYAVVKNARQLLSLAKGLGLEIKQ